MLAQPALRLRPRVAYQIDAAWCQLLPWVPPMPSNTIQPQPILPGWSAAVTFAQRLAFL